MQEQMVNKEFQTLRKKKSKETPEIKTTGTDTNRVFDELTSRPHTADVKIAEPEDVATEIFQSEIQSKKLRSTKHSIQECGEITKYVCIDVMGVPDKEKKV